MTAFSYLLKREFIRFFRQRGRVIGALATPILFWILMGSGLSGSFVDPSGSGQNYRQFFFPGAIMMSVLFTAIFSTISVIEDRNEGFLQGILVSPLSTNAFVLSKLFSGSILGLAQANLLLLMAPFIGLGFDFASLIKIEVALLLIGLGLSAVGFLVAWISNSIQGYHSMMNLLLFPLWLLSGAVFPVQESSPVLHTLAIINPVAHSLALVRLEMSGIQPSFPASWLYLGAFAVATFLACRRTK